VPVLTGYELG